MNICCCNAVVQDSSIIKILGMIIPFFLGLISSFIIDKIRFWFKKRKIKNFILAYLGKSILEELPKLKIEYEKLRKSINDYSQERYKMSVFEGFNEKPLLGISYVDYYEILKGEFILFSEILSMMEFLRSNLPYHIMDDYYDYINNHLKEKGKVADIEHVKKCQTCIDKRNESLLELELRIEETNLLMDKINKLIKKCGNK